MNIERKSMSIETYQTALSEALQRGVSVQKLKDLGRRLCEAEQRSEWLSEMRRQYETEHPEFRHGTESDWYKLHEEDGQKWSDLTDEEKENFKIKNDRPSFDEWMAETKEVTKTRTALLYVQRTYGFARQYGTLYTFWNSCNYEYKHYKCVDSG